MGLKTCGGIGFIQVYMHGKIHIIFLCLAMYAIYQVYVVVTQFLKIRNVFFMIIVYYLARLTMSNINHHSLFSYSAVNRRNK